MLSFIKKQLTNKIDQTKNFLVFDLFCDWAATISDAISDAEQKFNEERHQQLEMNSRLKQGNEDLKSKLNSGSSLLATLSHKVSGSPTHSFPSSSSMQSLSTAQKNEVVLNKEMMKVLTAHNLDSHYEVF